jgi:hypothetical protein
MIEKGDIKMNKSEIEKMLKRVTNLASIEVKEKTEDRAVIFLEFYNLTYKLKKDDWDFITALQIAYNIEISGNYDKFYKKGYLKDIPVFSAYELLELRETIETDRELFKRLYMCYFYEDVECVEFKKEAFNKQYILDYITFINRLSFYRRIHPNNNKSA